MFAFKGVGGKGVGKSKLWRWKKQVKVNKLVKSPPPKHGHAELLSATNFDFAKSKRILFSLS